MQWSSLAILFTVFSPPMPRSTVAGRKKSGRPRDQDVRRRILAAALALLSKHGIGALTMEAIAADARVSKQTIYNWWPSRGTVALDAMTEYARNVIEAPAEGAVGEVLTSFLTQTF